MIVTDIAALDAQIEDAQAGLARAERAMSQAGHITEAHAVAVEDAQRRLEALQARRTRLETLARFREREQAKAAEAVTAHEKAVKANASALKKEQETLAASKKKADDAVKAAGVAVARALQALGEHDTAVQGAADRLAGLGLLLTDEYGNRFEEGAQKDLTTHVRLGGAGYSTQHLGARERAVQDVVERAVKEQRPAAGSWRKILHDTGAQRQAGRDADAERARRNPNIRRAA
ncbi:hypothetical protein ACPCI0_29140 [Streptomyces griseoincarnatus]